MNHTVRLCIVLSLALAAACTGPGESVTKDTSTPAETTGGDAVVSDAAAPDLKGEAPPCVPQCDGTHCGADNCGGGCVCPDDKPVCNDKAQCEVECVPECSLELGAPCPGDDGCGGECDCPDNQECNEHHGVCAWSCDYVCLHLSECGPWDEGWDGCDCGECPDDGDPCTDEVCADGVCEYAPNAASCDDDDACTAGDVCAQGACAGTPKECDDGNDCTADSCNPDDGECIHDAPAADGQQCDDGNACTGPDACAGGSCFGELLPLDEIPTGQCLCEEDTDCDPLDDANICNGTLYCAKEGEDPGLCQIAPDTVLDCDDGIMCTGDQCDPVGGCVNDPDDGMCNDQVDCTGDSCNPETGCENVADDALCNDLIDCTADVCDPEAGCAHLPDDVVCDDANVCTDDMCTGQVGCENKPYEDGTPCGEPGGGDTCQNGLCTCVPDCEGKVCGDDGCGGTCGECCGPQSVCIDGQCPCQPVCELKECGPDGCCGSCGECDWTQDCVEGICVIKGCDFLCDGLQCGFVGPNDECNCGICDDGEDCTIDSCNEDTAECDFDVDAAIGQPCDDNFACTEDDVCVPGLGCEGTPVECDDGNECTMDFCDLLSGNCSFSSGGLNGSNCDDGNPCTSGEKCSFGVCVGIPKALQYVNVEECPCDIAGDCAPYEDGSVCTGTLGCLESDLGGHCYVDPATVLDCDDDVECTTDSCHPTNGCTNSPNPFLCLDQAPCTADSCDPELGCQNIPDDSKCDDGNPCTAGWCDPESSCTYAAKPEGFVCGEPIGWGKCSKNGVCQCAPVCTAEHACGDDGCGGSCGECPEWAYECIDGECIADCDAWCEILDCGTSGEWGECVCGDCNDGSECTIDICEEDKKCRHIYKHDEPCDDGSECTADDFCVMAACLGTPTECGDDNECTVDSCDPDTGQCVFDAAAADGLECNDGVPCTTNTKCSNGQCQGESKECDDGSDCTVDSCDEATGVCQHAPLTEGTECDDANPCTNEDKCTAGSCKGQLPAPDADILPECKCVADENCAALEDGNPCNGTLFCNPQGGGQGICDVDPASLPPCDDGVGCTDNLCDPGLGCSNPVVHEVCADDVECSTDICHPIGDCINMGYGINCDDGNDCTFDACNMPIGCQHTPLKNGTPCGVVEGWGGCQDGQCACMWKCQDITCGDNGCGGTCGDCPGELNECVLGNCECEKQCGNKQCGPDGCGGYCGGCDWENSDCGDDFKCHCFYVECQGICCAIQEECIDGYCQNLINPPPVRLTYGVVTPTTMEIIMESDQPVTGFQINYSILEGVSAGGGLMEEHFSFIMVGKNILMALGIGSAIPPGKGVLVELKFDEMPFGSGFCLIGDTNVFGNADGGLEYQAIPPCYWWGL